MPDQIEDLSTLLGTPSSKAKAEPKTRAPRRSKTMSTRELHKLIAQGISTANLAVFFSPYSDDALNDAEIDLLATAITAEFEAYPALQTFLNNYSQIAPHLNLVYAIAVIGYPRMVRHGIIPNMSVSNGENPPVESTNTSTMDAGGTPSDPWGYGNGQNNISSIIAAIP